MIPAGVTLTWLHHPAALILSSPDQPKHGWGAQRGGPSIPQSGQVSNQQASLAYQSKTTPEMDAWAQFLFLTGVKGRKNTSIKNQSASEELRIQGKPGQTSDLCPSYVSLFLSLLLDSSNPFLQSLKILHKEADIIYTSASHTSTYI